MVEIETVLKIKCLRLDNCGYFTSKEFMDFCREQGIKNKFSIAKTHQQNGVAKINNRTTHEMAKTMLKDPKTGDIFWAQKVIQ
jgi:hypothetical protein